MFLIRTDLNRLKLVIIPQNLATISSIKCFRTMRGASVLLAARQQLRGTQAFNVSPMLSLQGRGVEQPIIYSIIMLTTIIFLPYTDTILVCQCIHLRVCLRTQKVVKAAVRLFDHARNEHSVAYNRSLLDTLLHSSGFHELIRRISIDLGQIASDYFSSRATCRN